MQNISPKNLTVHTCLHALVVPKMLTEHKASVDETTEEEKNYRQMMRTNDVGPGLEGNGSVATVRTPATLDVRADKLTHPENRVGHDV